MFRQDFTCPALLDSLCMAFVYGAFTLCGHPSQDVLLAHAQLNWANPGSLAATAGISVDFFSSGYLDVSVLPVRFRSLCIQLRMTLRSGCPIRRSPDITLVISSPRLFADFHVLLRLLSPRHPPCALIHLIIQPQVILPCAVCFGPPPRCRLALFPVILAVVGSLLLLCRSSFRQSFSMSAGYRLLSKVFLGLSVAAEENISNNVLVFLSYSI